MLATRAVNQLDIEDAASLARLLHQISRVRELAHKLAGRAAAGVSLEDPWGIADLLEALLEADARQMAHKLAGRAAKQISADDPWGIAWLTLVIHEAGFSDAVNALQARYSEGDLALDNSKSIISILRALRGAGAGGTVVDLLALRPGHFLNHLLFKSVAEKLQKLPKNQAPDAVAALAAEAAQRVYIDPWTLRAGIGELLGALHEMGAGDAATVVATRAAERIPLDDLEQADRLVTPQPREDWRVTEVKNELRQAGATEASKVLAIRAADRIAFGRTEDLTRILQDLRDSGAEDTATAFVRQAADAGFFSFFLREEPGASSKFAFGREPDGAPSPRWKWNDLTN
jgi:hypothetical protein